MSRINVMKPWLGADEVAAVTSVIESGWIAQGPRVTEFENAFADAMTAEHAVALSKPRATPSAGATRENCRLRGHHRGACPDAGRACSPPHSPRIDHAMIAP